MKKIFLLFVVVVMTLDVASAQIRIVEKFDDGASKFEWSEFADKTMSTLIKGGCLEMSVLSKDIVSIWCDTYLPIDPDQDFKITAKLLLPKIEEGEKFGVLIDRDEEFNKLAFLFEPGRFIATYQSNNQILYDKGDKVRIKLEKGKDQILDLQIERRGGTYIVSYNNMEVYRWRKALNTPYFAFFTTSKLKIDELVVEQ